MEKTARQWLVPVVCSVYLACTLGPGTLTQTPPPPVQAAPASEADTAASEVASLPSAQDPKQTPEAAEAAIAAKPEEGNLAAVEEFPLAAASPDLTDPAAPESPSSELADLAADAPDVAGEAEQASEEELALIDELNDIALPEEFDLEAARQEALKNTTSELPVVLNSQVAQFINYFTSRRGKKTVVRTLERAGAYRGMIERILEEEGVPKEMFHLAQAESGFRPKARSRARATGMWQFMKFRGRQYGLRSDKYVDERYDPEKATRAAARHLLDLYIQFDDWYLAMAAYNGGPTRVKRAVQRTKSNNYWVHSKRKFILRETRNYVPIILAMTYVGKNLDIYDIEIKDPAPPLEYDTIETDSEVHLDLIADIAGTTAETIKQLNPALLRSATPPYSYDLRLPKGSSGTFLTELNAVPQDKRLAWRRHKVRDGDSLVAIATRYKVKQSQVLAHNQVQDDGFAAGTWLTIPAAPKRLSYYGSSGGGAGGFLESGTGRYRIARGDTLGGISQRFGASIANLRAWNGLSGSRIVAGRYLIVKSEDVGAKTSSPSTRPPANARTYRIAQGDTLGTIARRHGISVAQLKAWNGLRSNRIQAGGRLIVGEQSTSTSTSSRSSTRAASSRSPSTAAGGRYRIRRGDSLASIARRFGVGVDDLKAWNGLRGTKITAGDQLIVSQGPVTSERNNSAPVRAAATTRASTTARSTKAITYTIRRGDNLGAIAEQHGVTASELRKWNGMRGSRIVAGNTLKIHPALGSRSVVTPAQRPSTPAPSNGVYTIRSGDNLGDIADRFGVSVRDLQRWNGLRGTRITAGKTLVLRETSAPTAAGATTVASAGESRYRIRRGDTLAVIAKRFGVSVGDLQRWNGLRSSRIREGRYLTVSPAAGDGG
jgi:membrane-bound lytic murein transglycosylase D